MRTVLEQSLRAVARRWRRNLLTLLALSLSAASIAVIVIVAQGSALRTVDSLQDGDVSRLTVGLPYTAWEEDEATILSRLGTQPGMYGAGTLALPEPSESGAELTMAGSGLAATAGVAVATASGLELRGVELVSGSAVGSPTARSEDVRTVLLGVRIADELGVSVEGGRTTIMLNGVAVHATGVIRDGGEGGALSASVVMSPEAARALDLLPRSRILLVDVRPSAAAQLGSILPYAAHPSDPSAVSVQAPSSPQALRAELLQNANDLVLAVGLILVGVAAFTIVTTMQIAVMERRKEIGIARALGRSRFTVAAGFLTEAALISTAGTVLGTLIGVVVGKGATAVLDWTFVVPPALFLVPLLGLAVGSIAGAWPAYQAARTNPAELLRG